MKRHRGRRTGRRAALAAARPGGPRTGAPEALMAKLATWTTFALVPFMLLILWAPKLGFAPVPMPIQLALLALLVLCLIVSRRDTAEPDPIEQARDRRFNARRGLGYFLAGLIAFPVLTLVTGRDVVSLSALIVATLFLSLIAGIIGCFTARVPL
ncbi:hypothetical protein DMC47_19990 [Nostoc sp. 3335mG]|nr:hypothetical protein DMC47_19990 [Nostoc sp. 3335mG]